MILPLRIMENCLSYKISRYLECDEGNVCKMSFVFEGDLNHWVDEFFNGCNNPKMYEDFVDLIKNAKIQMKDWGK